MSTVDSSGIVGTVSGPTLIPEIATQFDNTDTELDARPKKAVAETITANWTFADIACDGFTSTGIDDITTAARLELADLFLTLGATGSTSFTIRQADNDNYLVIQGGTSGNSSGMYLYGSTHALAGDVAFYGAAETSLRFDYSASEWDFQANDVTTTGAFIGSAKYNNQTGTTYTIVAADNGKIITFDNAASIAVTLPDTLDTDFHCTIVQVGAGVVTVTPATDTINGAGTGVAPSAQWKGMYLSQYSATNWLALL